MKSLRTICLILPCLALANPLTADHHLAGFIRLFDGKTLDGWDGNPEFWSISDGAITGQTTEAKSTKGNTFIIWRGGTVDDFELRLKYRIVGGNSGIQYRSEDLGDWVVGGYQADFEAGDTFSGILYHERGRGILAKRGEMTRVSGGVDGKHQVTVVASLGETSDISSSIKKEDWNEYTIIARGGHFTHVINGRVTCQVLDEDAARARDSGILALQLHAGPPMQVQFKDIYLKPLKGIDISGKWSVNVSTDAGTGSPSFEFRQDGNALSGEYDGLFGQLKFKGAADGNKVKWTVLGSYDGQDVECVYTGEVADFATMKGTVSFNGQYEGTWTAEKTN